MEGIGLADAIEMLRSEILEAQSQAAAADVQFPIQTLTVTLKAGLTKLADGKVEFKVPFWGAGVGASAGLHQETTQTVTLVLGPPVNRHGETVQVAGAGDMRKE
jgi:hypothetical protein